MAFALWASHGLALHVAPVFDEVLHVAAADEMLQGLPPSDLAHPPGCRWLIALGLALGPGAFDLPSHGWTAAHAWAWRMPSVVAASLALGGTLLLARALGLGVLGSLVAALLLALDGVFFVHARLGMTNAFSTCFIVAASGLAWLACRRDQPLWLLPMGVALGASLGTRWTGAVALGALGLVCLLLRRPWSGRASAHAWDRWAIAAAAGFAVVPAAVYVAICLPMVWPPGASLLQPASWGEAWGLLADLHARMVTFHQYEVGGHPYHSPWWSWPLLQVPLWYQFVPMPAEGRVEGILALGNPTLWLAAVPAWAIALRRAWRHREAVPAFVGVLGMLMWMAWSLTGRATTFSTYFGEALPFAAIAIAWALGRLTHARLAFAGLLCAAVCWAVWMHPLLVGLPLTVEQYGQRMVLSRWEFFSQMRRFRETAGLESTARYHQYLNGLGNRVHGLTSGPKR
ncbi:MAG: phospholipid carrier-dependent glycosyltransferase [Candidatus Sericytochromatia bacterium]|nr:phospholipid carrier-dependent glycosyltransferase [Candidatus Sericytochromatia bacterium]